MSKSGKWKALQELREKLNAQYSGLFDLDRPKPFKLGIARDILAAVPGTQPYSVAQLMHWLTDRRAYLFACTLGAKRFGLKGMDGFVTEIEADYAQKRFGERMSCSRDEGWAERVADRTREPKLKVEISAPTEPTKIGEKPFWAKCPNADCGHCWAIAFLPMEMSLLAKITSTAKRCPKCGTTKPQIAKQNIGVLLEPARLGVAAAEAMG